MMVYNIILILLIIFNKILYILNIIQIIILIQFYNNLERVKEIIYKVYLIILLKINYGTKYYYKKYNNYIYNKMKLLYHKKNMNNIIFKCGNKCNL